MHLLRKHFTPGFISPKIDSKLTVKNVKTGEKSETSENNKKRPKATEKRKKKHTGACRVYPKRGK